jgi:hypothetical protein
MKARSYPWSVDLFLLSGRLTQQFCSLVLACQAGFWLGVLPRETLQLTEEIHSNESNRYTQDRYNESGLRDWEQESISAYFQGCKRLLVGAAGGGREILALCKAGYEVDGFECNPRLVEYANDLARRHGLTAEVQLVPRDQCLRTGRVYDGVISGWGAHTLIQGRKRRVAFLRALRAQACEGSPILVSFLYRTQGDRRFNLIVGIGNLIRGVLRRERLELGDDLLTTYAHRFTRQEIASELHEAGFELKSYGTEGYGYAVGIATGQPLAPEDPVRPEPAASQPHALTA